MRIPLIVAAFSVALTGCSLTPTNVPVTEGGASIRGNVHGGQQPIAGAHVFLFAANSGVVTPIASGYGNASVSLLKSAANTTLDTSGGPTNGDYYATTDTYGGFSLSGDYVCTANTQVYVYAIGGNPGGGTNSASGLLALVGNCPAAGNFIGTVSFIYVNEVSTIAAAYAFAGFASDAIHVSAPGGTLAQTGIANAFLNASNLVTLANGMALTVTPAGNGVVPQATINTLANILAYCVNSADSGGYISTNCSYLFGLTPSGGSSPTTPTDTASAAINIAHNPGVHVSSLWGLTNANAAFAPYLNNNPPNDWTIGIGFAGGGLGRSPDLAIDSAGAVWVTNQTGVIAGSCVTKLSSLGAVVYGPITGGGIAFPFGIAIDGADSAWVVNQGYNNSGPSVTKISTAGAVLLGPLTGGGMNSPLHVAIDAAGSAWIPSETGNVVTVITTGGTGITSYPGGGGANIALDGSQNFWISNATATSATEINDNGVVLSGANGYTGGGLGTSYSVAIDGTGNVWLPNFQSNGTYGAYSLTELGGSNAATPGMPISPTTGYTGGGLADPEGVAIDGANNVWVANASGAVSEFSNAGAAISGSGGYTGAYAFGDPTAIAVDGSGNVWVSGLVSQTTAVGQTSVGVLIGAATPAVTPVGSKYWRIF